MPLLSGNTPTKIYIFAGMNDVERRTDVRAQDHGKHGACSGGAAVRPDTASEADAISVAAVTAARLFPGENSLLEQASQEERALWSARAGTSIAYSPGARFLPRLALPVPLRDSPSTSGLQVKTIYYPAAADSLHGAEFSDVLALPEQRIALAVGGVTGAGVEASSYAADVRAALRDCLRQFFGDPAAALACLSDAVIATERLDGHGLGAAYAYASIAVIDIHTGEAACCSAGTEPPFLFRRDTGDVLDLSPEGSGFSGPVLGASASPSYDARTEVLGRGDLLTLFTSSITESLVGSGGRRFGYDGLVAAIRDAAAAASSTPRPLAEVGEAVVQRARTFAGRRLRQDIHLLLARRS